MVKFWAFGTKKKLRLLVSYHKYVYICNTFQSLPTGRFAKPCRVLSPACVLTSPTARHFDTARYMPQP